MNHDHPHEPPGTVAEHDRGRDDHPHTHETEIIVNSRPRRVTGDIISFEQLVQLAYPHTQPEQNVTYSVTYRHAAQTPHQGELAAGGSVKIKNGTVFNVVRTVQS